MVNEAPENRKDIEQGIEQRGEDLEKLADEMDLTVEDKSNVSELAENLDFTTVEGFADIIGSVVGALESVDDTYEQQDSVSDAIVEQSLHAQAGFCDKIEMAEHNAANLENVMSGIKSAFEAKYNLAQAGESADEEKEFFDACLQLEKALIDDNIQKRHTQRYQLEQIAAQQRFLDERQIEKAVKEVKAGAPNVSSHLNPECSKFHKSMRQQLSEMKRILVTPQKQYVAAPQKASAKDFDGQNGYTANYKKPKTGYGHNKS